MLARKVILQCVSRACYVNLGKSFHLLVPHCPGISNRVNVACAIWGLQKWRVLYHCIPRKAKSRITLTAAFLACHSWGWFCCVLQAALTMFVPMHSYVWRFCNEEQDTVWIHLKPHRPGPWAPSACVSVITEWHDRTWENRDLQIRCTEVNPFRQFCWH